MRHVNGSKSTNNGDFEFESGYRLDRFFVPRGTKCFEQTTIWTGESTDHNIVATTLEAVNIK
jgi:hypothetical protein